MTDCILKKQTCQVCSLIIIETQTKWDREAGCDIFVESNGNLDKADCKFHEAQCLKVILQLTILNELWTWNLEVHKLFQEVKG